MSARLQRYRESFALSYTFGVYPTLELLSVCPESVEQVLHGRAGARRRGGREGAQRLPLRHPGGGGPWAIRRVSARFFPVIGVFRKRPRPVRDDASHVVLFRPG